MNCSTIDRDAEAATTLTDDLAAESRHCRLTDGQPAVMTRDLRHAIDLLRAVPSAGFSWRHTAHDVDRRPLRSINQPAHRFSLPPLSSPVVDHLHARQCSSLTDDVVLTTGAL